MFASNKAIGSAVEEPTDPFFENVTALLHFNGTNGAQNNTFLDSSTNNFTITRNGNTTQGSFSPFSRADGNWSNYFDGSGDYLSVGATNTLNVGTGDFTIEGWFYMTSATGGYITLMQYTQASQTTGMRFGDGGFGNKLQVGLYLESLGGIYSTAYTQTSFINQWHHIAMTRQSGVVRFFVDGQQQNLGTGVNPSTYPLTDFTDTRSLGTSSVCEIVGSTFQGYVSGVRFIKNTALYTSSFTPSITPPTAITNTSLLTCRSNRFIDNSANAFAITVNGNPSVQAFGPFNPTTAYTAASNGGSGYFDGSGDYLVLPQSNAYVFTSDFTIEAWIYLTTYAGGDTYGNKPILTNANGAGAAGILYTTFGVGGSGYRPGSLALTSNWPSSMDIVSSDYTVPLNAWTHVAAVRSGSTIKLYVNGVQVATGTYSGTVYTNEASFSMRAGHWNYADGPNRFFTGWMSQLRVVKGTAVYTAAFTPPTAPLTAITNTSLLLNFTNGGIFDNAAMNNFETFGNGQLSTSVKKFGTASLICDNSYDGAISYPLSPNFGFGLGNFTIEGWFYINSGAGGRQPFIKVATGVSAIQVLRSDGGFGNVLALQVNSNSLTTWFSGVGIPQDTWHHIAVSREGTNIRVFMNGTLAGTLTGTYDLGSANGLAIGYDENFSLGDRTLNGYADEIRITKGVARYTANFTPPALPFPDK